MEQDLRESLAGYSHNIAWSGLMRYIISKGAFKQDGSLVIPARYMDRWYRQMNTLYNRLPEEDKESYRAEADRILEIVELYE